MPKTMMFEVAPPNASIAGRMLSTVRSYTLGPYDTLREPKLARLFGNGAYTESGIRVNEENAFTFSAMYDGVNQISSDTAKMPLNLLKRRPEGGSDHFVESKTYRLLKYEPNPDMGSMVFRRTLVAHALTCKGGFAEIERDNLGRPHHLWILTPDRVEPFVEKSTLENGRFSSRLRYRIDGSDRTVLESKDIIHIRGLGYDGVNAYPLVHLARQAIGLALAAEQFGGAFFANGGSFGGVLAADTDVDETQAGEIQDRISKIHAGAAKAWKMLVLGAGFKYYRTGVTPSESQMDDLRDKQVEEVARFLNMPLHKLKSLARATNNNIEQQDLEYYKGCLLNWITLLEEEFNRKLISPLEARQQFIKHNANVFLRGDIKSRYDALGMALDKGVINADEWRELEDMNPQVGGQGKTYFVQGAMVPKDKIGEIVDAKIAKDKMPKVAPAAPAAPAKNDSDVKDAEDRAAAAQALLDESRAREADVRERLAAAEATATSTAAEREQLRTDLARATEMSAQFAVVAEFVREKETALRARTDDLGAQLATADAARLEAERQRIDAETRAAGAEAERDRRILEATSATDLATVARSEATASETRANEAATLAANETTNRAAAEAARDEAVQAAEAARQLATAAEAASVDATTRASLATATADQARAEADRLMSEWATRATAAETRAGELETAAAAAEASRVAAEAARTALEDTQRTAAAAAEAEQLRLSNEAATERARADTLQQNCDALRAQLATVEAAIASERSAHGETLEAIRQGIAAIERERDTVVATSHQLAAAAADATRAREAVELEIRTVREADVAGMAALIAAHRDNVADVMRRMLERETDRALAKASNPDKLRAWLDSFYEGHADLMRNALLPAVRIHLTFIRSDDDPIETTRRLVDRHIEDSRRQIGVVLDGDADAIAASLPGLLRRWETQRGEVIANDLMQKELNYARAI